MGAYVIRRLILGFVSLCGVVVITFLLVQAVPGDPAVLVAGPAASPEVIERIRADLGLDEPLHQQFLMYVERLIQVDLGESFITRRPVAEEIRLFFPATVELIVVSMILMSIGGIFWGVVSAVRRNSLIDHAARVISLLGAATPAFWLAILAQLFAFHFLVGFPIAGRVSMGVLMRHPLENVTGLLVLDSLIQGNIPVLLSALQHLILPVFTLTICFMAGITRLTRASMIHVMQQDYIRTAEAMGVGSIKVIYKYALRNALIPPLTFMGTLFGFLLGGVVLVEFIFSWPGIGRHTVDAIGAADFPVVMGVTLVSAVIFLSLNLIVDMLYVVINPAIEYN